MSKQKKKRPSLSTIVTDTFMHAIYIDATSRTKVQQNCVSYFVAFWLAVAWHTDEGMLDNILKFSCFFRFEGNSWIYLISFILLRLCCALKLILMIRKMMESTLSILHRTFGSKYKEIYNDILIVTWKCKLIYSLPRLVCCHSIYLLMMKTWT